MTVADTTAPFVVISDPFVANMPPFSNRTRFSICYSRALPKARKRHFSRWSMAENAQHGHCTSQCVHSRDGRIRPLPVHATRAPWKARVVVASRRRCLASGRFRRALVSTAVANARSPHASEDSPRDTRIDMLLSSSPSMRSSEKHVPQPPIPVIENRVQQSPRGVAKEQSTPTVAHPMVARRTTNKATSRHRPSG